MTINYNKHKASMLISHFWILLLVSCPKWKVKIFDFEIFLQQDCVMIHKLDTLFIEIKNFIK